MVEKVHSLVTFLAYCLYRATDVPSAKGQGSQISDVRLNEVSKKLARYPKSKIST